jgi:hypothetical protein
MIQSIKAIILKELRENLLWAALVSVISAGVLVVGIYDGLPTGLPLVQKSLLQLCMIMYSAAGVSLGFLQVQQDARRGRWQFVMHRPLSRSQLFAGKIAAGIALYLLSTVLPLLMIFVAVSIPGYIAGPVTADMLLPALAYIVAGLMWYAAGLLIAARQARWLGSRLMPVALPILSMMLFNMLAIRFSEAVLMMLPTIALLLLAAWGVFIVPEGSTRSPLAAKICMGISVSVGWMMGLATVMTLVGGLIDPFVYQRPQYTSYYELDQHGELKIVQGVRSEGAGTLPTTTVYLTAEYAQSRASRVRYEGFLSSGSYATLFDSTAHEQWYCIVSHGIIKGYDTRTGRFIGSIGQDGFAPPGVSARPFDHMQRTSLSLNNELASTIITRNSAFVLNIPERQVRKLFSSPADDPVAGAALMPARTQQNLAGTQDRAIVTRSRIHFLHDFTELASVPRDPALGEYYISIGRTDDGNYVTGSYAGPVGWNRVDVFVYDREGKLIRQTHLPAEPQQTAELSTPWWYMAGMLIPNPPAFFVWLFELKWSDGERQLWMPLGELMSVMAVCLAVGFNMLRVRHATRLSMAVWLVMVACLGLSGIFLLMSMWEKPTSVRCPACGKRRLVTEERCTHCSAVAQQPSMEGIEIFAAAGLA